MLRQKIQGADNWHNKNNTIHDEKQNVNLKIIKLKIKKGNLYNYIIDKSILIQLL